MIITANSEYAMHVYQNDDFPVLFRRGNFQSNLQCL